MASDCGVMLNTKLEAVTIEADTGQMVQVVTNLVSNALHYNSPGGRAVVEVSNGELCAVLTVSDTGQGIGAGDLPRIFERFYRADKSRSRAQGRTGLGLAITKAIVEAHGGTIEARSELGRGSTFTVRLPAPAGQHG